MFTNCAQCGLLIFNSPAAIERHGRRHPQVEKILRLERVLERVVLFDVGPATELDYEEEPDDIMCQACTEGDCDLCDGGVCECPCSIYLDRKVRRKELTSKAGV